VADSRVVVPLHCLVPADHPAAAAGRARLRDLNGHSLVLPPREQAPAAHDDLVSTCERHGFLPVEVAGVADDRLVHGLVAAGGQVSFTTDAPSAGDATVVVPIDDQPLAITLRLAWRGALGTPLDSLPPVITGTLIRQARPDDASRRRRPRAASELPAAPA
jgi:DNA-binding transcriptional LysR family regulator